jgi:hypothetical protein
MRYSEYLRAEPLTFWDGDVAPGPDEGKEEAAAVRLQAFGSP